MMDSPVPIIREKHLDEALTVPCIFLGMQTDERKELKALTLLIGRSMLVHQ
jgi:hypothetical protein